MKALKLAFLLAFCLWTAKAPGQPADDPDVLLQRALHLGDLYNWYAAGPLFAQAEKLYNQRGDNRNALYAHVGHLRSLREQLSMSEMSDELSKDLSDNPLVQNDKELRLFCLHVKGDIDGEIDAAPMRRDWEGALQMAQELGDKKWQNRASAEIGFAMFLQGDMMIARQKVAGALITATSLHDAGAQMRYLSAIGQALVLVGAFEDAQPYFDKALAIAATTPDAGYQYIAREGQLEALKGLGKLDAAQELADQI